MSFVTDLGLSCTLTPVAVNGPHVMLSFKSTCLVRFVAERVGSLYYSKIYVIMSHIILGVVLILGEIPLSRYEQRRRKPDVHFI